MSEYLSDSETVVASCRVSSCGRWSHFNVIINHPVVGGTCHISTRLFVIFIPGLFLVVKHKMPPSRVSF